MKRGTTPVLPVHFSINNDDVETIEFLFKQEKSESAPEILLKTYPGEDVEYKESYNIYNVAFTSEETRLFAEDQPFYMDTRITMTGGSIPETPIVTLRMHPTLFAQAKVEDEGEDENEAEEISNS